MVNDTLLNFGKRYEDDLRVIFDQWQKLHIGLDALSNQKILKGIYWISSRNQIGRNHRISIYKKSSLNNGLVVDTKAETI